MDFLENLQKIAKLENIFGVNKMAPEVNAKVQASGMPAPSSPEEAGPDMEALYNKNATSMPEYQKPRLRDRLFNAGSSILTNLNTPANTVPTYDALDQGTRARDIKNWQNKGDELYRGAVLQDKNTKERNNVEKQRQQNDVAQEKLRITEDYNNKKADAAESRVKVAQDRAASERVRAEAFRNKQNILGIKENEDGTGIIVHTDGSTVPIQNMDVFSAKEKEEFAETHREKLEGIKHSNRSSEIAQRGSEARTTKSTMPATATKAGSKSSANADELARMRRLYNNANQALAQHPEWKKFIKVESPTKPVTVAAEGTGSFLGMGKGLTKEERGKIIKALGPDWKEDGAEEAKTGPKIGDTKKFPNGKTGKWDGKGWELQ